MSGKSKARREAKTADRAARGNQRAQAELQRRWHLTLKQQREVDAAYAKAAAEAQRSAPLIRCEVGTVDTFVIHRVGREVYPADLPDQLRAAAARDAARIDDEFLKTVPGGDL